MAWTEPRTWEEELTVTASMMNQEIRDNLLFLFGSERRLYTNVTPAGNVTTVEVATMQFTVDGDTLETNGQALAVLAWGTTAATVLPLNPTLKRIKAKFGSTGVLTAYADTNSAAGKWAFGFVVTRSGPFAQTLLISGSGAGGATAMLTDIGAASETLASSVLVSVTVESVTTTGPPAATAVADDIRQLGMIVRVLR